MSSNSNNNTIYWNDVHNGTTFVDGSTVVQRHQTHDMECIKLTYLDTSNKIRTFIASKDHLICVNIQKLPKEAADIVKQHCSRPDAVVPTREDISIDVFGYIDEHKKQLVYDYVVGNIDSSYFNKVEDISNNTIECYLITFKDNTYKEVFVKRATTKTEPQKIDEFNYWVPLEGIMWLYNEFGEIYI